MDYIRYCIYVLCLLSSSQ